MALFTAAAAVGTAVLGAVGITAVGVTFATVAVGFLTQAALGLALNALTPKPGRPTLSSGQRSNRGYRVNQRGAALDHQIIYGRARVGGAIVHVSSNGAENKYLYQAVAYAGHEIESFDEIYINDAKVTGFDTVTLYEYNISPTIVAPFEPRYKARSTHLIEPGVYTNVTSPTLTEVVNALGLSGDPFPNGGIAVIDRNNVFQGNVSEVELPDGTKSDRYNGFIRINQHLGSPDQLADNDLVTEVAGWTADHRLRGIAYLTNIFVFDADVFPNGVPKITATIKGKKVYDPNSGTTYWSDNPALCLRDYLTSGYGLAESAQNIDDDLVVTAANVCDDTNTQDSSTRYTCNGAFTTESSPYDTLSDMLTSMGGLLWYAQGQWRMKPAYWVPPTITFTEDDLRSSISVKTRHSRRDNFNTVRGTFRGEESDWQVTDYPEVSNPAFVTADGGQESVLDIELPFTDTSVEARRIARIALERNRQQLTVIASFGMRAFQVQVGDVVNLTIERFGWETKAFEVASWTFGLADNQDLQVQMVLREISENVFDEVDDGVVYERDNSNLPSPFITVAPQNLTVSDGGFTTEDGTFVNSFIVDWDAPNDAFADYYVLEWRAQGEFKFKSVNLRSTEYQIAPVVENTTYEIRVKAVNTLGVSGPYATVTATVGGDATAPGLPTSLAAEGVLGFINISWVNPVDRDLNFVEVWESADTSLSNATQIAAAFGSTFNRGNLAPLTTRYYWIRAVDFSDNKSAFVGPASATTRQITTADIGDAVIPWDALDPTVENVIDSKISTLEAEVADEYATITEVSIIENDVDGLEGKYGVTIDNNNNITGFQLLSGAGGSAFNVRADQFAVFNSDGTGGDNPFTIFTSARNINGVIYPAGTYIKDAIIDEAAIVDLSVDTIKIRDGAISRNNVASGIYSAATNITITEAGWVTAIATFTQGNGKNAHFWRLYIGGVQVQTESPIEGTTGAMTSGLFLPPGTHTCTIQNDIFSGDGRCGITVFGLMK